MANFAPWFISMMCAIALIIVFVVLVCIVKRNRGGKYSVHEKEIAHGNDPYEEPGFNEYNRPLSGMARGSRQTLTHEDYSDNESMTDYEGESSRFGEDGSFIGEYGQFLPTNISCTFLSNNSYHFIFIFFAFFFSLKNSSTNQKERSTISVRIGDICLKN